MRSHVHLRSHPLHPILVAFPIAFFTGTFVAHALGWWLDKPALLQTASYLNAAGVVTALLAAVPGLIDLLLAVPPRSSARMRGIRHGLLNTLNLLVFTACYCLRREEANNVLLLGLEVAGLVLLSVAGWMGGTLVYRNQIGVDHRYANAGKWQEVRLPEETGRLDVGGADELKMNAMKLLRLPNRRLVLARTEDGFVAFDDHCPHKGGPLSDGSLACGTVQCPWHGSQFRVSDGSAVAGPAREGIKVYPVKEEDGRLFLYL